MREPRQQGPPAAPEQTIGRAIQDLTAARLGRGFVPLALLLVTGLVQLSTEGISSPEGLVLVFGVVATAAAMLAYGLRVVQNAFGRQQRAWMSLAMAGSVIPPMFALYVLGWRGLKEILSGGLVAVVWGVFFTGLGVWAMRAWMRVVEVERLARVMAAGQERGLA